MRLVAMSFIACAVFAQEKQEKAELKDPASRPKAEREASEKAMTNMVRQIQRSILTLPQYGVFDSLRFGIKGSNEVYLRGHASRPTLKDGAEREVKRVEGVEKVVNEIEVLPNSPADDDVRWNVYRNIYGHPTLSRYNPNRGTPLFPSLTRRTMGITQDPPPGNHPIHIVVNRGNVTLEGVVQNTGDRTIAEIQANTVPGVFSVTNNLVAADEVREQQNPPKPSN